MFFPLFRRAMSSAPTSHFITLPNRPIVRENGEITRAPLQLHYWEWQGHQPTVLICHGGMLHGRCYDRIVREALAGFHVIALDFRGHGRSAKHPLPYPFPWFGEDVFHFIQSLAHSQNDLLGIGHSLGGHAIVFAAAIAPQQLFRSILLLDPGIFSSETYQRAEQNLSKRQILPDRKARWSSTEEMISYMSKPDRLAHWPREILRDYCTYALDENFQLQCTPELAAHLHPASVQPESNLQSLVKKSPLIQDTPVHVVRASRSLINNRIPVSPTAASLASWFKKGRDTLLRNGSHSFPTEEPAIAIDLVKEMIDEIKQQL